MAAGANILNLLKADNLKFIGGQANYNGSVLELAETFGAKRLGFHLETLDPKKFSCPYHWHSDEEELFVVLEGEAIVRSNGKFQKVGPGDVIFYNVGPESVHNMYNHTDKVFKFLAISNISEKDYCEYPDSKKLNKDGVVTQNGQVVNYFKDEEDPAKYWPEHALRGEV